MNRRPLEADLHHYKKKYQEYEQILKDQEAISSELLEIIKKSAQSVSTDEFQQRLSLNNKNIEVSTRALQEVRKDINEIEFMLKSRKNHIEDCLRHINKGGNELPECWLNHIKVQQQIKNIIYYDLPDVTRNIGIKEFIQRVIDKHWLFAISEITTRLALRRSRINDAAIDIRNTGCYVIENNNHSMTIIHYIEIGKPDAFVITEYYVENNKYNCPAINLVSDKLILCNKSAINIFSSEDILIEETNAAIKDIRETLVNQISLKIIINCLNYSGQMQNFVFDKIPGVIEKSCLLASVNHSDWILLHNTLAMYMQQALDASTCSNIISFLTHTQDQARKYFYQVGENYLTKVFKSETLSPGLTRMRNHYLTKKSHSENFIEYQNIVDERGSAIGRSQQTIDLYQAITNTKFSINKNWEIDNSSLKQLKKTVDCYLNPPKTKAQLETELKQYEKEYKTCERSIQRLEVPIHDARKYINENLKRIEKISMTRINTEVAELKETLLDLDKHVQDGIINIKFHPLHIKADLSKHEISVLEQRNFTLRFTKEKMHFGIYTFVIKGAADDSSLLPDPDEIYLHLLNQKITCDFTSEGLNITYEEDFYPNLYTFLTGSSTDNQSSLNILPKDIINIICRMMYMTSINTQDLRFFIEDQPIKLSFKNHKHIESELIEFSNRFAEKKLFHKFRYNMISIDIIIEIARNNIKFLSQNILNDFIKCFPGEKIAEMIDSHSYITNQIEMMEKLSSYVLFLDDYPYDPECLHISDYSYKPHRSALDSITISRFFSDIKPYIEKIKQHYSELFDWATSNLDNSIKIHVFKAVVNIIINGFISKCDEFQFISLQNSIDEKIRQIREIETKILTTKEASQAVLKIREDFYQSACDNLIKLLSNTSTEVLTPELTSMKKYYLDQYFCATEFINYGHKILVEREMGWWNSWKSSSEISNLYTAITNINFDKNENKTNECLNGLIAAIQQYKSTLPKASHSRDTLYGVHSNAQRLDDEPNMKLRLT